MAVMRYRTILFCLLLCLALAPDSAADRFKSDFDTAVTLTRLRQNPHAYLHVDVFFECRFNRLEKDWTPFYTPFTKERYMALSVWDIGQRVWVEEERLDDFPFMYMRRDREDVQDVIEAPQYTVFRVYGRVKDDFMNLPWFEVYHVEPRETSYTLTDEVLRRLIVAQEHLRTGMLGIACEELEWVLDHRIPADVKYHCCVELARAYYLLENYDNALRKAKAARGYAPENLELKKLIERSVENRASMEAGRSPLEPPSGPPQPIEASETGEDEVGYLEEAVEVLRKALQEAQALAAEGEVVHWWELQPDHRSMRLRREGETDGEAAEQLVLQLPEKVFFRRPDSRFGVTPEGQLCSSAENAGVEFDPSLYDESAYPGDSAFDIVIQFGPSGSGGPACGLDFIEATANLQAYFYGSRP